MSKIPTLPSHKRTCPMKNCEAWTFPLSMFDKRQGEYKGFPMYERTTKWKCENGHRTDTVSLVDWEKHPIQRIPKGVKRL